MNKKNNTTRGYYLAEMFLAKQRAKIASVALLKTKKHEKLLDIGCGSYPYFLEQSYFKRRYGLDPMVDLSARQATLNLYKQSFVGRSLPFTDDYFDAISLLAVAEHLYEADDRLLFKEAHRVLNNGGVFVLTTPAPWTEGLLSFLAKINIVSKEEEAEHKSLLSIKLLKNMLVDAGFSENQITSGYFELGMNQWVSAIKTI